MPLPVWTYDLAVPDDATDAEIAGYRDIALSTWRTAVEATGAYPEAPSLELREAGPTSESSTCAPTGSSITAGRFWHVEGQVR